MRLGSSPLLVSGIFLLAFACDGGGGDTPSSGEAWRAAQEKWRIRDIGAYRAWQSLDPESAEGKLAATLLARADRHYLEGIRLLEAGRSAEGQQALMKGAGIAPIDPAYYYQLAKMYDQRELDELALKYYQKCIAALPDTPLAGEAERRILALDRLFDPPVREPSSTIGLSQRIGWSAFLVALLVALFAGWLRRGRGVPLSCLIDRNPELHSAIAYLIGSLRHELLKHRIGAVSDVLAGWGAGDIEEAQRAFLHHRLYGGVPVEDAWNAHLAAFRGALGPRLNLDRDRAFRRAGSAIRAIQRLQLFLNDPGPREQRRLLGAHRSLKGFDRYLAKLQARLVRTRVDEGLLRQVVDEVRGEYSMSGVRLDRLEVVPLTEPVYIEVPRGDLVLILKNILRNAIFAVAGQAGARVVRMYAERHLEPTGEEAVHLGVADTGEAPLDREALAGRGVSSGLGLVATAVKRYGGTVSLCPAEDGAAKAVDIRFFRAFENADAEGRTT